MTKPIFLYVDGKGFVMDFEKSGPELKFAQCIVASENFETVSQANHTIRSNHLDPVSCVLLQQV